MSERPCASCDHPLTTSEKYICRFCAKHDRDCEDDWDFDLSPEEEAAAERSWANYQARSEWDHYHPGEPCPDIELPYPRNREADSGGERTGSVSNPQNKPE